MWVIFKNLISLDVDKFGHVVLVNKFVLKNIFNSNFLELGCPQKLLNLILNDDKALLVFSTISMGEILSS